MKKFFSNKLAITLFVLPAVLTFSIFILLPIIQVLIYSFTKWNGVSAPTFIGFKNYINLFDDSTFALSNKNQFIFAMVITLYQMLLASVFAITMSNRKTRGRKFLRVAYFIPVVLSVTVVTQLWASIYSESGLFNSLFRALGMDFQQSWLSDRTFAIYAIAFVNAWQWMGYQFALIMAGIKSIPSDYYEASQIDGCSNIRAHMKITIPLLKDTYRFCLIMSLTGGIKAFTEMFIMVNGGPGTATYTLTMMMYTQAFRSSAFGYGLSAAVIMVLECMMVMLLINFLFKDRETSLISAIKIKLQNIKREKGESV